RRLFGDRVLRRQILRRPAIRQDDDHRHRLLVGVQVVEDHVGLAAPRPLLLVAADAVEEVENRIFPVLGVPRRRVDLRLALHPDRRRVVLDRLQLATVDAFALDVKALWRRGERFLLVLLALRAALFFWLRRLAVRLAWLGCHTGVGIAGEGFPCNFLEDAI